MKRNFFVGSKTESGTIISSNGSEYQDPGPVKNETDFEHCHHVVFNDNIKFGDPIKGRSEKKWHRPLSH